jgi:NitT/TauT family transport system permease protein
MRTSEVAAARSRPAASRRRRGGRRFFDTHARLIIGSASVSLCLLVWELYARSGAVDPLFLPAPTQIAPRGWELLVGGDLWPDLAVSGLEFAVGFTLAVLTAIPLGLAAGWYRALHHSLNPFLLTLYALPRVALVPWIILIFGIGFEPKVVMVFMGVFFPLIINTRDGVRTVNQDYLRLAQSFGASRLRTFLTVVLPATVPFILACLRVGIGTGFIGLVIAEFITASQGLGYRIHVAGHVLDTPTVFVGIVILATASIALTRAVDLVERRFRGWQLGS